jgi:hypothetical protein
MMFGNYQSYGGLGATAVGHAKSPPPEKPKEPPPEKPPEKPAEEKPKSPTEKAKSWWDSQQAGTKVAVGVGAAAAFGAILYLLFRSPQKYTSNRPRGLRAKARKGQILVLADGSSFGHRTPPKRYWKAGAKRQSDYAWPEGYKYPLVFRQKPGKVNLKKTRTHIRAAETYFERSKDQYPPKVRRTIARNINKAKKRYGVGGLAVSPSL